jgi:hypothetical protein
MKYPTPILGGDHSIELEKARVCHCQKRYYRFVILNQTSIDFVFYTVASPLVQGGMIPLF